MPVVRGSCLCGGVKYEITGPLMRSGHCHCSNCRKAHGAAFRSRARVRVEDFKWVQGKELVKYFESSPGFHRGFCSICGSPIVNRPHRTPELGIALGGLDDDNRTLAASGPLSPLGDIESQEEHSGQHIRMVSWQGIANR
jgi:hypothetical protein